MSTYNLNTYELMNEQMDAVNGGFVCGGLCIAGAAFAAGALFGSGLVVGLKAK